MSRTLTITYVDGSTDTIDISYGRKPKVEGCVLVYDYNEDYRGICRKQRAWPLEGIRTYRIDER